jgi:Dehydrogenases with different specificities (related to short-chain alcohol dehydrogenases)
MSKHLNEFIPQEIKKLSRIGIYFNCLRIGVTDTSIHKKIKNKNLENRVKLIPLNRPAKSSEISHYLFYLGSEQNKYISNQIISVSGGE